MKELNVAYLIMAVFLSVIFGMLVQKALTSQERPSIHRGVIKEWQWEKEEGKRRWEDYQDRRDNSDSGIPDYRYVFFDAKRRH